MATALDQEQRGDAGSDEGFRALTGRLNRASEDKHFHAYTDVDWDAPECALVEGDPRLELGQPAADPPESRGDPARCDDQDRHGPRPPPERRGRGG